jgi:hypothetical protein
MSAAAMEDRETTRELFLNFMRSYYPRSHGRRQQDGRRWWATLIMVLLQGGFVGAWKVQFDAWQKTLEVERKLRDAQTTALVEVLHEQAQALRELRTSIEANTKADAEERAAARARREGGR